MVHHFAPGSLKPRRPLPLSQGRRKPAQKKRKKEKKREKRKKKRSKKKGGKTKVNSRKKKQAAQSRPFTYLRERLKFAPGEYTNPAEPINLARPSKQLPSFNQVPITSKLGIGETYMPMREQREAKE